MEMIAFVLGFVALALLALRFGQDSREGIRSKEHDLAAQGMTWTDLAFDCEAPAAEPASPNPMRPYPTLAFIERALGASSGTLLAAPDAERLEVRARELTADYWSDAVWTTGVVPETAFRRVIAELAPGLLDAPVLAVERPTAVAEPVKQERRVSVARPVPQPLGRATEPGRAGSPATA